MDKKYVSGVAIYVSMDSYMKWNALSSRDLPISRSDIRLRCDSLKDKACPFEFISYRLSFPVILLNIGFM